MAPKSGAVLALLALTISGCAENSVRLEAAKAVSNKSAVAMKSVAGYFAEVEDRRRVAAAALIASDPSCRVALKFSIQVAQQVERGTRQPLCPTGKTAAPGYLLTDLDFAGTPEALLKPRLLLIAAVADYGVALAKIVDDPKTDITADITEFGDKLDRVGKLLTALGADDVPTAGGVLQSEEGKSVLALLSFASDLLDEARRVKAVREEVRLHGGQVDEALDELKTVVDTRVATDIRSAQTTLISRLERVYDDGRRQMDFAARHDLATTILDARVERDGLDATKARVLAAIAATQAAQQGLRDALLGNFTAEQRRRIVSLNLDRLTHAFELIAAVGTAFI